MEPKHHKLSSQASAGAQPAIASFDHPDELINLAQQHYAHDFPNPARLNCPGDELIKTTAFSGKLTNKQLLAHIFKCSECYNQLQSALASYRASLPARRASLWSRIYGFRPFRPAPVLAASLILLFLILSIVYLAWKPQEERTPIMVALPEQRPQPSTMANNSDATPRVIPSPESSRTQQSPAQVTANTDPKNSNRQSAFHQIQTPKSPGKQLPVIEQPAPRSVLAQQRQTPSILPAMAKEKTIAVDLDDYSRTRGDGAESIKLPQTLVRLRLRLPVGSSAGRYLVSLSDGTKRLQSRVAQSRDGINLIVKMDLERLGPRKYILRIEHEGSVPDEYNIVLDGVETEQNPKFTQPTENRQIPAAPIVPKP